LWDDPSLPLPDDASRRRLSQELVSRTLKLVRDFKDTIRGKQWSLPNETKTLLDRQLQGGDVPSQRERIRFYRCIFEDNEQFGESGTANALVRSLGSGNDIVFQNCIFRNNLFGDDEVIVSFLALCAIATGSSNNCLLFSCFGM
jgi:hypothetical protein